MESVKLELSLDEANLILGIIGKQPYDQVAGVISKMQMQYTQQQAETNVPEEETEKAE